MISSLLLTFLTFPFIIINSFHLHPPSLLITSKSPFKSSFLSSKPPSSPLDDLLLLPLDDESSSSPSDSPYETTKAVGPRNDPKPMSYYLYEFASDMSLDQALSSPQFEVRTLRQYILCSSTKNL